LSPAARVVTVFKRHWPYARCHCSIIVIAPQQPVEHHMSSNSDTRPGKLTATQAAPAYSYSRKRWNAFDTWQEHVRKSAHAAHAAHASHAGVAFSGRHDRDLRRAIVTG
jgi:hypothetical protein